MRDQPEDIPGQAASHRRACWTVGDQTARRPPAVDPVPGAALDPVNWARNVNIHEIQAANGSG